MTIFYFDFKFLKIFKKALLGGLFYFYFFGLGSSEILNFE
jgi:hypothetical protein